MGDGQFPQVVGQRKSVKQFGHRHERQPCHIPEPKEGSSAAGAKGWTGKFSFFAASGVPLTAGPKDRIVSAWVKMPVNATGRNS